MLSAEGLRKRYRSREVVRDFYCTGAPATALGVASAWGGALAGDAGGLLDVATWAAAGAAAGACGAHPIRAARASVEQTRTGAG